MTPHFLLKEGNNQRTKLFFGEDWAPLCPRPEKALKTIVEMADMYEQPLSYCHDDVGVPLLRMSMECTCWMWCTMEGHICGARALTQ